MTSYMNRNTSAALKGVALIFMFIHHFFTIPDMYVAGVSYPALAAFAGYFREPFKMCVSVFAFLTGYFYAFGQKQNYRHSFKKMTDLLISYWFVFFPVLGLALLLGCCEINATSFLFEAFALRKQIMEFCWYVPFYLAAMLMLPLLVKLCTHTLLGDAFVMLFCPVVFLTAIRRFVSVEEFSQLIMHLREWFPCIASGYLCAKHAIFEKVLDKIANNFQHKWAKTALWAALAAGAFAGRYICQNLNLGDVEVVWQRQGLPFSTDIIYAPLFIYGVIHLLRLIQNSFLFKGLMRIGNLSMLMWFMHCIFFNVCKEFTQPILYFPRNPLLVLLFGLLLCYAASALINIPLRRVLAYKNKR